MTTAIYILVFIHAVQTVLQWKSISIQKGYENALEVSRFNEATLRDAVQQLRTERDVWIGNYSKLHKETLTKKDLP